MGNIHRDGFSPCRFRTVSRSLDRPTYNGVSLRMKGASRAGGVLCETVPSAPLSPGRGKEGVGKRTRSTRLTRNNLARAIAGWSDSMTYTVRILAIRRPTVKDERTQNKYDAKLMIAYKGTMSRMRTISVNNIH